MLNEQHYGRSTECGAWLHTVQSSRRSLLQRNIRGVIPMKLYCDTMQVQVKQLKCDTYYCTQCRGAVRITQLLVLIEQHLKVKHRVRRLTAHSAEDT